MKTLSTGNWLLLSLVVGGLLGFLVATVTLTYLPSNLSLPSLMESDSTVATAVMPVSAAVTEEGAQGAFEASDR